MCIHMTTGMQRYSRGANIYGAVTKILSCRVNTTSRQGIKQLGISFYIIFLPFSCESSSGRILSNWGNPQPPPLNDSPGLPKKLLFCGAQNFLLHPTKSVKCNKGNVLLTKIFSTEGFHFTVTIILQHSPHTFF